MKRFKILSLFVMLVLGVAVVGETTVVRSMTRKQMTAAADLVVYGRVIAVTPTLGPRGRRIFRDVRIMPIELLKGTWEKGVEVGLLSPGGTLGDVRMHLAGTSQYAVGEEVVVFLEKTDGHFVEIAVGYGKYAVVPAPDGRKVVERHVEVTVAEKGPLGRWVLGHPKAEAPVALQVFLAEIRAYVCGEGAR